MNARLLWLAAVLLLPGACSKPAGGGAAPPPSASSPPPVSSENLNRMLQAELWRDRSAVGEEDLQAPNAGRRLAAVRSLARIQDERSFEALRKALADEDPEVVDWAAFGVGELCREHEPEAVKRLTLRAASLLAETASAARDRALGSIAFAIGRCASEDAEDTLRSWLKLPAPLAAAATLGLGQVARRRQHLDDRTVAALLDAASRDQGAPALYPLESVPALSPAARERLLEVATRRLDEPSGGRAFAVRALGKAGAGAAPALARLIDADLSSDAERADAARALGALGSSAQSELARALHGRARALIDRKAWLSTQVGVVLTLLEGLEPKQGDPALLAELSRLPLEQEPPVIVRRKVMLRCRAAAKLADRASASAALNECDPAPPAERREGSLAVLSVLGRGPLTKARGARFRELLRSPDRRVREAALELLMTHDEVEDVPELLAAALGAKEAGVRATAAQVLARYPARAQQRGSPGSAPGATPPADPRVVQELTRQLAEVGKSNNIELSSWLLDAATALELLGVKPALERACASSNPTLRRHAEKGFAQLGERQHRCPTVPSKDLWQAGVLGDFRLEFATDVGPLSLTLSGKASPFATQRLIELSRAHFFDGMPVHRVVPGFVVQLGDPDGDGFGGPDLPPLRCQVQSDPFELGSVGIALAGRDTGLSQFFVTLRRAPHLAGEYSLIGHAEPGWERLVPGDRILEVRVLEAGK